MGKEEVKSALKTARKFQVQFKTVLLAILIILIAGVVGYKIIGKVRQKLASLSTQQAQQEIPSIPIDQVNPATPSAQPNPQPLPGLQGGSRTYPAASAPSMTNSLIYRVKRGDTTQKLAWKFYRNINRYREIERANALAHNAKLFVGERLVIPIAGNNVVSAASSRTNRGFSSSLMARNNQITNSAALQASNSRSYTVKPSDSLWKISAKTYRTGTRWPKIYTANRRVIGNNPNLIYPRTRLTLPR